MRFDYQPTLSNTRILKTSKQRKFFLIGSLGLFGCLFIVSSLIHTAYIYNTPKIISYTKIEPIKSLPDNKLPQETKDKTPIITEKWLNFTIKSGDTLINLLNNLPITTIQLKDLTTFIKNNTTKTAILLKTGQSLRILLDENNNLKKIQLAVCKYKTLFIDQVGPRTYKLYTEEKPIIKKLTFASNNIVSSFFSAAQEAGLNDTLIMEMADIFGWDIDFVMDIKPNDKFRILYEEKFVEHDKIGTGHILAAEFINQGHTYRAIRFTDANGKTGYYSPEGYGMNKTFLRNPVKFTRIGSKFSTKRHHPILHRIRAHKGVDYVAPYGTPIKAAADGKVISMGRKGSYGNVVELQHGSKYSTLYAHLSKFAHNLKKDTIVKQGQVIGYVGHTGLATGDHLHYEFRVDGIHRDPLTVQFPKSIQLPSKYRSKFLSHAQQTLSLLDEYDVSSFTKK